MYNTLKKLIEKRFYKDRETALSKVEICFAMNKITQEQFIDLNMLIDEYYPEEAEEVE